VKQSIIAVTSFFLALALPFSGKAEEYKADEYYQIYSVSLTEEVPTAEEIAAGYIAPGEWPDNGLIESLAGIDFNAMVLIGEKVVEILKRGAPVVNIKRDAVSVMPLGVQNWQQLAGWQIPVTKVYRLVVKNYFRDNVVDMRLKVSGMWGGSLHGKGQYLANVVVVPAEVKVLWGWSLDLWAEHREPVNAGSHDSPVAGLGFDIRYKIATIFNELNGSQDYYITGDGKIVELK
jgi:hypothetical protein